MKSELEQSLFEEFKLYGLPLPTQQYRFHPVRLWKLDFAWPEKKIALEVNGGIFINGRHGRGAYAEADYEKLNEAQKMGWKVFQFGPSQVRRKKRTNASSKALEYMFEVLKQVKEQPPAPLRAGFGR